MLETDDQSFQYRITLKDWHVRIAVLIVVNVDRFVLIKSTMKMCSYESTKVDNENSKEKWASISQKRWENETNASSSKLKRHDSKQQHSEFIWTSTETIVCLFIERLLNHLGKHLDRYRPIIEERLVDEETSIHLRSRYSFLSKQLTKRE